MTFRKLGSSDLEVSEISQVHANAKASGIELAPDTLAAIGQALGDVPVKGSTLGPLARSGVSHR